MSTTVPNDPVSTPPPDKPSTDPGAPAAEPTSDPSQLEPDPDDPTPPGTNPDDGHPSQADRTTEAPPRGTPRPDPEQISEGLSDYGVVSAGGHVGPETGDQAAGRGES
jgi:hypothetical protein